MHCPDPMLTASVYCEGGLDGALARIVAPLLERLRQDSPAAYVWTVRFGRRGQHLKLRAHATGADLAPLRDLVGSLAESFFAAQAAPPPAERPPRLDLPPIDPDDEAEEVQPDRTLLWTRYRRSHVSLGGDPWLSDDVYAARMTECLGRGCESVLAAVAAAPDGSIAAGERQKLILKALMSGLPAAGLDTTEGASSYLRYHRDWLLRFFLGDESEERAALDGFDRQLERMASTVARLGEIGLGDAPPAGDREPTWAAAVARLSAHLATHREDPEFRTDPFAPDAAHPALFKVFHGTANQAGLRPLEEAFVHHLLETALGATRPAAAAGGGSR